MKSQSKNLKQSSQTPPKSKYPQEVRVFSKDGKTLTPCSMFRAKQMIKRGKAIWIGPFMVQILYDRRDIKKFKQSVLRRDRYCCYIDEQQYPAEELTVDHIRSRHKGGSDFPENLACCSIKHNQLKGHMSLEEYVLHLIHDKDTDEVLRSRLIMRFPQYVEKGDAHEYTGTSAVSNEGSATADHPSQ